MAVDQQTVESIDQIETIVDTDVHTTEDLVDDLFPHLPDPFDELLNIKKRTYEAGKVLPSAGYVTPNDYGTVDIREVNEPEHVHEAIDQFDLDRVVLTGGHTLRLGMAHHEELASALATAYNDWTLETLVDTVDDCYAACVVAPDRPEEAAEEIDDRAGEDGIVGVLVPSGGVTPPLGREKYFPIYEAAEDNDLPLMFHGAGTSGISTFPTHWQGTKRYIDIHVTAHPADHMFHLSTMLTNGVPERFPDLDIVFQEAGVGWIPYFMRRYDNEYSEKRQDAPLLEKKPSEYIREQFYFSSQPFEGADDPQYISNIVRMFDGGERLMFSTDYPHVDFDNSDQILKSLGSEFSPEELNNIYGGTALDVFDF
jgi:predicted TIM-barrel fold metal-dependent hydrolase